MSKYLWLAVTADEYELPLVVADSAEELGAKFGVKANTVISAIARGYNGRENGYKYVRVLNNGITEGIAHQQYTEECL